MATRRCIGCGLAAEPGDVYCIGCREAVDGGSSPGDWPEPRAGADDR